MKCKNNNSALVVALPLYQGCTLLDFAGATQIFAFAGNIKVVWLAENLVPIATTEGVSVNPTHTFNDAPQADIVFVPGGGAEGVIAAMNDPVMQRYLKTVHPNKWLGSVCTGAFIVAAAGLFDGHAATTYWSQLENLNLFPEIQVDTQNYPRYLLDDNIQRFSGGGISSSLDLALALLVNLRGKEGAEQAQLANQYAPKPPVDAGDPSSAPASLVTQMRQDQQASFIEPIRKAVEALIT